VAVSGGPDSVCLLHILAGIRQEQDVKLHVAHLNHQLRGPESEAEAEYVSGLARSLGLPVTIASQDAAAHRATRHCSLEEAARELRYAFLADVATDAGATRVATGHTRDDQVETVLMHLLRGTGTGGLGGLAPSTPLPHHPTMKPPQGILEQPPRSQGAQIQVPLRGGLAAEPPVPVAAGPGAQPPVHLSLRAQRSNLLVVRPLLEITREETTRYCQRRGLHPRLDSSNLSLSFLRNRLRLELLPRLRQYNPSVDEALLRLADIARDDAAFIAGQASTLWEQVTRHEDNAICLDRKALAALPVALQRQVLRTALAALAGDVRDIEAVHIESARSLLQKPVGKEISLPRGLICRTGYDELTIAKHSAATSRESGAEASTAPVVAGFPPWGWDEGGHRTRPYADKPRPGRPAPCAACLLPCLSGDTPLKVPGQTFLPGWRVTASIVATMAGLPRSDSIGTPRNDREESRPNTPDPFVAHFDLAKTGTDLLVRPRRAGDRFQPLGMNAPKKLQDFMVDARIPRAWRQHIPIVCSPQQIVWVAGWRIDDRVKLTEASQKVLRLKFVGSR
jgi:tRNA(Ile)-lysidine synthase